MTKIILNGAEVEVDPKQPLIAACHQNGAEVPHYCYHAGLTPVGSCRMCQVEVKEGDRPGRVVAACRTPVSEGMVVDTEAPKAHDARRECLEFLLKNHPLDCPICDKAGECMLQDYSYAEGQAEGQSAEPRRKLEKRKDLGDVILLDQERCILCSRCVRFFEEVTGEAQLCIAGRGAHSFVDTFAGRPLSGNYQGNVADICPVGALTLKQFRFKARVWNLHKRASTCGECSRGCAISVEVLRKGEVKRIRPRYDADVNKWWMCDTGRFAFEGASLEGRLEGALERGYSGLAACSTDEALALARDGYATHERHVFVASPWLTVEEGAALLELAKANGGAALMVSPAPNELKDDLLHTGDPCPNRRGLTELGFEAATPEEVLALCAQAETATLVGERVADLVGREGLAALDSALRLYLFDTKSLDVPAARVNVGVPCWVERAGTWVNVDGHRGPISAARSAPAGVRPTLSLLSGLAEAETSTSAGREA